MITLLSKVRNLVLKDLTHYRLTAMQKNLAVIRANFLLGAAQLVAHFPVVSRKDLGRRASRKG